MKNVVIIGPNFSKYVFKESPLTVGFLDERWEDFKSINSQSDYDQLIKQLVLFSNKESMESSELSLFSRLVQTEASYKNIKESSNRLLLYKNLIKKYFIERNNKMDSMMPLLLAKFIAKQDYILSYQFDLLLEELVSTQRQLNVCVDRQSFLSSGTDEHATLLYKFYGSIDNIESTALTMSEKLDRTINMRIAISKISQFENASITAIGFDQEEREWKEVYAELVSKMDSSKISFVKFTEGEKQTNQSVFPTEQDNLIENSFFPDLKSYLSSQSNSKILEKENLYLEKMNDRFDEETKEKEPLEEFVPLRGRNQAKKKRIKNASEGMSFRLSYKAILLSSMLVAFAVGLNFFFSVAVISGQSMSPSYKSSDYILLNKQYSSINRFDVIAFDSPDEAGQEYIKRVIGLPGDSIEYRDDQLYIDGNLIEESYLDREKNELNAEEVLTKDFSLESLMGVKEVPKDKLFVLGDNRLYSRDSRAFGFVDIKSIKGDVKLKLWPIHIGSEAK